MPIFDIEIVIRPGEHLGDELASELANCIGEIFGMQPGTIWVTLRGIPTENYAENGGDFEERNYPVFVSILKLRLPKSSEMQVEVNALTSAIARVCDRPQENVHLFYQPEGIGRMAFGGKIIGDGNGRQQTEGH